MPIFHAIVLGIVQGLSEFLPISSSAHLTLIPELFHWTELTTHPQLNKTFDVALHVGTLFAAVWYFRADLAGYVFAGIQSIRTRRIDSLEARMAWLLVIAAIPGAIAGALFEDTIEEHLSEPVLIGAMMVVFGIVLLAADTLTGKRQSEDFSRPDAVKMGMAQALALQPGVSRSGVTISMGRWVGFDRESATRLSFLMSISIIAGAAFFKTVHVVRDGIPSSFVLPFVIGILSATASGLFAIGFLLKFVQTKSFLPFVIYRVVVGFAVIFIFATGLR